MTVWLMPIPLTLLVVGALGTALRSSLDHAWARGLLLLVAVAVYVLASRGLRRALPRVEAQAMGFRALTAAERSILVRLLDVDDPAYERLRSQLPHLLACTIDKWGSFALLDTRASSRWEQKVGRGLPYLGFTRDADDVPIHLAIMVTDAGQLYAVEVTRLDGNDLRSPDWASIVLKHAGPA
jgi:hypothetical protein